MGKRILLVDDEPGIVTLLKTRFEANAYEVDVAVDGVDALKKTVARPPDIIVTDVLMPRMTGFQFLKALKDAGAQYASIPVVVISGNANMKEYFDEWKNIVFFEKPLNADVVMREIARVVGRPATSTVSTTSAPASPPPVAKPEPTQSQPIQKDSQKAQTAMLLGVEDFVVNKISTFLGSRKYSAEIALDANDAVETATTSHPDVILCQYWEDQELLNAKEIYSALQAKENLKSIPFYVFCPIKVGLEAIKTFKQSNVIRYRDADELLKKLAEQLQVKPPA